MEVFLIEVLLIEETLKMEVFLIEVFLIEETLKMEVFLIEVFLIEETTNYYVTFQGQGNVPMSCRILAETAVSKYICAIAHPATHKVVLMLECSLRCQYAIVVSLYTGLES